MLIRIHRIQPLPHTQRFPDDGCELELVVDGLGRAIAHSRLGLVGGRSGRGLVNAVLSRRPLDIGSGHDDRAGSPLVGDGEVEEGGRRARVVDDDAPGVFDVLQGAGEVLDR